MAVITVFTGLSCLVFPVLADLIYGPFTYISNGTNVTITRYNEQPWPSVSVPDTIYGQPVTSIGGFAFLNCGNTLEVTLPESVTNIGMSAFEGCGRLTSINIPDGVTSIGTYAFKDCVGLRSFTIPSGVKTLGASTFNHCLGLRAVYFKGDAPTLTSGTVFLSCFAITVYYLPGTKSWGPTYADLPTALWQDVPGFVYAYSNTISILQYTGTNSSMMIPDVIHGIQVTDIGSNAFASCTNLVNLVIPVSVTNMGNYVFSSCDNLTAVYFRGNAPSHGSNVFLNATNVTVYYLPGTTNWGAQFGERPTAEWRPQMLGDMGTLTNQYGFNISWASGMVVIVEACTNLADFSWTGLQTNILSGDSLYFSDPHWTNYPGRYYRINSP